MALPRSKTTTEIAKLSPQALSKYFDDHARFDKSAPQTPYGILFHRIGIFSDDTLDLRMKFEAAVAKFRTEKKIKQDKDHAKQLQKLRSAVRRRDALVKSMAKQGGGGKQWRDRDMAVEALGEDAVAAHERHKERHGT